MTREERVRKLALARINAETLELDTTVHELKSVEATEINNLGTEGQLDYIIECAGVSFLSDIVGYEVDESKGNN